MWIAIVTWWASLSGFTQAILPFLFTPLIYVWKKRKYIISHMPVSRCKFNELKSQVDKMSNELAKPTAPESKVISIDEAADLLTRELELFHNQIKSLSDPDLVELSRQKDELINKSSRVLTDPCVDPEVAATIRNFLAEISGVIKRYYQERTQHSARQFGSLFDRQF